MCGELFTCEMFCECLLVCTCEMFTFVNAYLCVLVNFLLVKCLLL